MIGRVLVIGTGAMGSLFAACLARLDEVEVCMAGSWVEALEAVQRHGVEVEDAGEVWRAPVAARSLDKVAGTYDVVLVLTKSWRTRAIAHFAAQAAGPSGRILTLQNGLGNRDTLSAVAAPEQVMSGATTAAARLLKAARVRVADRGQTLFGEGRRTAALARLLTRAGLAAETSTRLPEILWNKLAINCAINPLTALHGVVNGDLLGQQEWRSQALTAAREVGRVAAANGIVIDGDPGEKALAVARATASNRSSMLQDIERGAPTEIEALNGAVVAAGLELGVPTPVNARLAERVRAREAHRDLATTMSAPRLMAGVMS